MSDTGGFFALRHIPAGAYDIVAYQDRNGDHIVDFGERADTTLAGVAVNDTAVITLAVLPGDTTPARLVRAAPRDSAVTLSFDDYFDPDVPVQGTVRLHLLPDSTFVGGGELIRLHVYEEREAEVREARRAARRAAADTAAPDTVRGDTVPVPPPAGTPDTTAVPRDTAAGAPARPDSATDTTAADTFPEQPLPSRDMVLVPDSALIPERAYMVEVDGVVNIRGVPGGGGAAVFRVPAPERDTTVMDSLGAAGDTVPDVVPDTAPPDTVPAAPTGSVPPPAGAPAGANDPTPWWLDPGGGA